MVKKDQKYKWMERQERAFKELKEKFTRELVLAVLLWNALDTNIFLFLLSIFLDFIFLFF